MREWEISWDWAIVSGTKLSMDCTVGCLLDEQTLDIGTFGVLVYWYTDIRYWNVYNIQTLDWNFYKRKHWNFYNMQTLDWKFYNIQTLDWNFYNIQTLDWNFTTNQTLNS